MRLRLTIVNSNSGQKPSWKPNSDLGIPAGFIVSAKIQTNLSDKEFQQISQTAAKILQNPLEVKQLADKVYELMKADLHAQRDRNGNFRRWS